MHWLFWTSLCRTKKDGGLGFRNLECFNLAMLAKQAWRLVTSAPHLLLSRILKAKYLPRERFFTAEIADRPSTTWRAILGARAYLTQVLRRRIGNGLSTSIWGDYWFPSPSMGSIITWRPPESIFPDQVADLID